MSHIKIRSLLLVRYKHDLAEWVWQLLERQWLVQHGIYTKGQRLWYITTDERHLLEELIGEARLSGDHNIDSQRQ